MMSKIKVLQINKLYAPWIGGIESVVKIIAEELKDSTDMQVLVCQPKGFGVIEKVEGVKVIRAGSLGMGFSMPISFSFPFLVRKHSVNTDVIILHEPFPLGDLAVLLSGFKGKLIIFWHSDIVKQKKLLKLINPMIHRVLRRADAIFTTSEKYIDGSAYISKYREKCRIVPYGLNIKKYLSVSPDQFLTKQLNDSESIKVLFVGRLVYYKGVGVLMDAFGKVKNAELFIVGEGTDKEDLVKMTSDFSDKVHFIGNLSDEDLKRAFADCDIFVLPSIENSEAFGIVQLEAMVYGKPVINTNLKTSVPHVSLHNETGLTVTPGDSEELAEAISRLVNDRDLRHRLGENAQKRVFEHFDIVYMASNIKNQLKDIMEE